MLPYAKIYCAYGELAHIVGSCQLNLMLSGLKHLLVAAWLILGLHIWCGVCIWFGMVRGFGGFKFTSQAYNIHVYIWHWAPAKIYVNDANLFRMWWNGWIRRRKETKWIKYCGLFIAMLTILKYWWKNWCVCVYATGFVYMLFELKEYWTDCLYTDKYTHIQFVTF